MRETNPEKLLKALQPKHSLATPQLKDNILRIAEPAAADVKTSAAKTWSPFWFWLATAACVAVVLCARWKPFHRQASPTPDSRMAAKQDKDPGKSIKLEGPFALLGTLMKGDSLLEGHLRILALSRNGKFLLLGAEGKDADKALLLEADEKGIWRAFKDEPLEKALRALPGSVCAAVFFGGSLDESHDFALAGDDFVHAYIYDESKKNHVKKTGSLMFDSLEGWKTNSICYLDGHVAVQGRGDFGIPKQMSHMVLQMQFKVTEAGLETLEVGNTGAVYEDADVKKVGRRQTASGYSKDGFFHWYFCDHQFDGQWKKAGGGESAGFLGAGVDPFEDDYDAITATEDGNHFGISSIKGKVSVMKRRPGPNQDGWSFGKPSLLPDCGDKAIVCLAISNDGQWLAALDAENRLRIWELEKIKLAQTVEIKGGVCDLRFSPDAKSLFVGCENGRLLRLCRE